MYIYFEKGDSIFKDTDLERFYDSSRLLDFTLLFDRRLLICAEGVSRGLPAWLLTEDMRIRSSDSLDLAEA